VLMVQILLRALAASSTGAQRSLRALSRIMAFEAWLPMFKAHSGGASCLTGYHSFVSGRDVVSALGRNWLILLTMWLSGGDDRQGCVIERSFLAEAEAFAGLHHLAHDDRQLARDRDASLLPAAALFDA